MLTFIRCGLIGWCMEICWTGIRSMLQGDVRLTGQSSLWMFPIYGMASAIVPFYPMIKPLNILFRGYLYMICFFAVEYVTGSLLRFFGACPWDYSECRFQVNGLIRLDYGPAWFGAGLFFEWLLCRL